MISTQGSTIDTIAETPDSSFKPSSTPSSMVQSTESYSSSSRTSNLLDLKRQRIFSNPSNTESMHDYSYEDEAFAPDDIYYEADENLEFDVDDPQTVVERPNSFEEDDDDDEDGNDHFRFMPQGQYFYDPSSRRVHRSRHYRPTLHHSASLSEEIEWAQNRDAFEQENKDYEIIKETVENLFMKNIRASSRSQNNSLSTSIRPADNSSLTTGQGDDNNNHLDVAIEDGLNLIKNAISSALVNISPIRKFHLSLQPNLFLNFIILQQNKIPKQPSKTQQ